MKMTRGDAKFCRSCGYIGTGTRITPGLFAVELLLWLCILLPGLAYSAWRLTARYWGCPACGNKLIPANSPVARKEIEELKAATQPAPKIRKPAVHEEPDDQPNVYVIN